jgi:hypothetical protein
MAYGRVHGSISSSAAFGIKSPGSLGEVFMCSCVDSNCGPALMLHWCYICCYLGLDSSGVPPPPGAATYHPPLLPG